jgi:antirestriction protein
MTATQVQLKESTVEFMNELMEDNYYDGDMYVFINEYGEDNFVQYYEKFVECGENVSYDAVDAFIAEFGLTELDHFEDAYNGEWSCFQSFAENFFDDIYGHEIPDYLQCYIDYDAFAKDLAYDYVMNGNYVFNRNY